MAVAEPLWRPSPRLALSHAQYMHLSTYASPSSSVPGPASGYSRGRRVARRFGRGRGGAFAQLGAVALYGRPRTRHGLDGGALGSCFKRCTAGC